MNNKEKKLFRLIKSMTKNEKRFFHLHTKLFSKNKKSNYLKLFEVLDSMPEYNHLLVAQKTKKFTTSKNLPYLRNYLNEQILDALRLYHKNNHKTIGHLENLGLAINLYKRNFLDEAEKLLQLDKKKVLEKEEYAIVIIINNLLVNVEEKRASRSRKNQESIALYHQENIEILKKEKARLEYLLEKIKQTTSKTETLRP